MALPSTAGIPAERHEREMRAAIFAHNLCLLDRFGMDDLRSFIATVKHYSSMRNANRLLDLLLLADGMIFALTASDY